ncbi:MAG TPA: hypothetical protein DCL21_02115 [Alphaproteobacteria bacterium]|nr:hypothetical protein [Alphaproteobacteria bacterium]
MLSRKDVMFGFETRWSKKQSGGLFLVRLSRLTFRLAEDHQARRVQTAKGAMFGLDARIALAIFGALSVISGAALYSAIQGAKATALLTSMQEAGKAWEMYYLDTGTTLPYSDPTFATYNGYILEVGNLVSNSSNITSWQGPYLSNDVQNVHSLKHNVYKGLYYIALKDDTSWGDNVSWKASGTCLAGDKCFIWIKVNGLPDEALAKKIDTMVDGSDGAKNGNFKWWVGTDDADRAVYGMRYFLKVAPIKNPKD